MKIKICGIRRKEDIAYVNELKPDYVGFIFAKSTRQVRPHEAKELIDLLDKSIKKVGVFVNEDKESIKQIARDCSLDVLQLHGDEKPEFIIDFKEEIWKSFSIKDEESLKNIDCYKVEGYLLDTFIDGKRGGTGENFNWDLVPHLHKERFIILAGGLNIQNINRAIERVRPHVVDINSGIEIDGYKDFNKMKAIIERVREVYG